MSIGTTAALVVGGLGLAGGVASAAIGSSAATSAANTQASAADYAANLQKEEFDTTQANEAPFIQAGQQTVAQLAAGLQPGGVFTQPNAAGTFTTPTLQQAEQQPGYQFAQEQGDLGIEQGAAAAGGAFSSGTLKSLANYNNQLAQTSYQNTYNNALNTYLTQFNANNTNTTNLYNRLAGVSGTGQTAVGQLGQLGQESAATQAGLITGGAAAQAAGQIGSATAITNALNGTVNNATGYLTLQQILGGAKAGGSGAYAGSPSELSNFDSQGNFIPSSSWQATPPVTPEAGIDY